MSNYKWKYSLLPVLLIAILALGCKKPSEFDLNAVAPELIGDWEWDRSYFEGFDSTPQNDSNNNYSVSINNFGKIDVSKNDLLIEKMFLKQMRLSLENTFDDGIEVHWYDFSIAEETTLDGFNGLIIKYLIDTDEISISRFPFYREDDLINGGIIYPDNVFYRVN